LAGITHSAVSQNISALTKQLGVQLFHSQARGMVPTSYAESLYPIIKESMIRLDGAEDKIKNFTAESPGVIKIVCTTNFAGNYIAPHIVSFKKEYPNIDFDIFVKTNVDHALEMLEKGYAQLVLSIVPLDDMENLNVIELERFEQSFFTTKAFADQNNIKDSVSKKQFEDLPLAALRTIHNFADVKQPDIVVDSQDIGFSILRENTVVGFGIWDVATKVMDNLVKFKVEGIEPKDASLVCVHASTLPKAAVGFVGRLSSKA